MYGLIPFLYMFVFMSIERERCRGGGSYFWFNTMRRALDKHLESEWAEELGEK